MSLNKLMIIASEHFSTDEIISKIKTQILEYEINPSDENIHTLGFLSTILISKLAMNQSNKTSMEMINELDNYDKLRNVFEHTKNQS